LGLPKHVSFLLRHVQYKRTPLVIHS